MSRSYSPCTLAHKMAEASIEQGLPACGAKLIRDTLARDIAEREPDAVFQSDAFKETGAKKAALWTKLREELNELQQSGCSDLTEFADVLEVLDCLAGANGYTLSDILAEKERKVQERGSFAEGRFLLRPETIKLVG